MAEDYPHTVVISAIKTAPLNMVFLAHFILTTWGIQGYWSPDSYFFYNFLFFITLFWSIHAKESIEGPLLCLVINVTAILLDVLCLAIYFPRETSGGSDRFSVGMAILNLVLRPLSCIAIYQVWNERNSGTNANEEGRRQQKSYEGIEGQTYGSTPSF